MLPQDACQAGNVQMFKKRSTEPVLSAGAAPYVTGLSPSGRMLSAVNSKSRFYGAPLVAWTPSPGATKYDVEWSRTSRTPGGRPDRCGRRPRRLMLPLHAGHVVLPRPRDQRVAAEATQKMRWSGSMRVQIAKPTFSVSGG